MRPSNGIKYRKEIIVVFFAGKDIENGCTKFLLKRKILFAKSLGKKYTQTYQHTIFYKIKMRLFSNVTLNQRTFCI